MRTLVLLPLLLAVACVAFASPQYGAFSDAVEDAYDSSFDEDAQAEAEVALKAGEEEEASFADEFQDYEAPTYLDRERRDTLDMLDSLERVARQSGGRPPKRPPSSPPPGQRPPKRPRPNPPGRPRPRPTPPPRPPSPPNTPPRTPPRSPSPPAGRG